MSDEDTTPTTKQCIACMQVLPITRFSKLNSVTSAGNSFLYRKNKCISCSSSYAPRIRKLSKLERVTEDQRAEVLRMLRSGVKRKNIYSYLSMSAPLGKRVVDNVLSQNVDTE